MENMNHQRIIIADYLNQREIYFQNAVKFHEKGRYRKASEMLWGAVSQTIKALAATSDNEIRSHNQFRKFMRNLSLELGDRELLTVFWNMEELHKNFYDEEISHDEINIYMELATDYLRKLDQLIEKKKTERRQSG